MTLELRNPHSILAALRARPRDVLEIVFRMAKPDGVWEEVADLARTAGVAVAHDPRGDKPRRPGTRDTERVGGVLARVREKASVDLARLLPAEADPGERGVWLALDCLQDPQNVGAIFRSASFFGVRGVLVTRDRSCPINATVYDVSAGGVEAVPFCLVTNLRQALDRCREAGLWMLGTSEHASKDVSEIALDRPWLMVVGNEAKGLRRLTLEQCDEVCRLSPRGLVTSLNASVAAGVFLAILTLDRVAPTGEIPRNPIP